MARPKSIGMPSPVTLSSLTAAQYLGVPKSKSSLLFRQPRRNMSQRRTQPRKPYGFKDFYSNSSPPLKLLPPSFATTKPHFDSSKTTTIECGPNTSTNVITSFEKLLKTECSN